MLCTELVLAELPLRLSGDFLVCPIVCSFSILLLSDKVKKRVEASTLALEFGLVLDGEESVLLSDTVSTFFLLMDVGLDDDVIAFVLDLFVYFFFGERISLFLVFSVMSLQEVLPGKL